MKIEINVITENNTEAKEFSKMTDNLREALSLFCNHMKILEDDDIVSLAFNFCDNVNLELLSGGE